jgi:hypothetical protein
MTIQTAVASLDEASAWIGAHLERLGTPITGAIEQPHVRPWSTVLRAPTTAGPVYFKAVTPALIYEAGVTQALEHWLPGSGPALLAVDAQRGWMLMADGGARLRETLKVDRDLRHWEIVLQRYAELQMIVAPHLPELLALGLPDARPATLPQQFARLLADEDVLQLGLPKGLTAEEHQRLHDLAPHVSALCEQLAASSAPDSIDHGDLHDGNVFLRDGHYLFFDWGDSSAGHPFISLRTVFVSVENALGLEERAPEFERLLDAYLQPWTTYAPREELQQTYDIAKCMSPLCAALRWRRAIGALEPSARTDYAHAIPSLLREFLGMVEA